MMRLIGRFVDLAEAAVAAGVHPERIAAMACMRPLQRMGEEIGDARSRAHRRARRDAWKANLPRCAARTEVPMRLTVEGAATQLEGPLLFLRRTLDAGLGDAVEVHRRTTAARAWAASLRSTASS